MYVIKIIRFKIDEIVDVGERVGGLNRTMDAILTIPCACSRKSFDFHSIHPSAGLSRRQFSLPFCMCVCVCVCVCVCHFPSSSSSLFPPPPYFFLSLLPSPPPIYSLDSSVRVCFHLAEELVFNISCLESITDHRYQRWRAASGHFLKDWQRRPEILQDAEDSIIQEAMDPISLKQNQR